MPYSPRSSISVNLVKLGTKGASKLIPLLIPQPPGPSTSPSPSCSPEPSPGGEPPGPDGLGSSEPTMIRINPDGKPPKSPRPSIYCPACQRGISSPRG
jgi:hypothetical protein